MYGSFAKETCNFIDPTNRSHPIQQGIEYMSVYCRVVKTIYRFIRFLIVDTLYTLLLNMFIHILNKCIHILNMRIHTLNMCILYCRIEHIYNSYRVYVVQQGNIYRHIQIHCFNRFCLKSGMMIHVSYGPQCRRLYIGISSYRHTTIY